MQRKQIVTGKDYYYARHTNWQTSAWSGQKVTVVSDATVAMVKGWHGRNITVTLADGTTAEVWASRGTGAVVVRMADNTLKAVPTAHIRGEWDETKALVDANVKAQDERRTEKARVDAARRQTLEGAAAKIEALGLGKQYLYSPNGYEVTGLRVSTLLALLDMIPDAE